VQIGGRLMGEPSEKAKFGLSDAVTLFTHQVATINTLWAVYVAATFAAAGYGLSVAQGLAYRLAATVASGFLAFAIGNWVLLRQSLTIARTLQRDIRAALSADPENPFASSLHAVAATANAPWISLVFHVFIDTCVVLAIWMQVRPS
jgi:hypothetical protein